MLRLASSRRRSKRPLQRLERSDGSLLSRAGAPETRERRACGGAVRQAVAIGNPRSAGSSCGPAARCFLAFSEIHPDYYQIPVADRERLIAEQQRLQAEADDDEPRRRDRIDRTDIEDVREENRGENPVERGADAPTEVAAQAIATAEDAGDAPIGAPVREPTPAEAPPSSIVG